MGEYFPPILIPTPKPKKTIGRKNNNVVLYDPRASLAMPAIGDYILAACVAHGSTYSLVRESNACVVRQGCNQSQDDTYVNHTLEDWNAYVNPTLEEWNKVYQRVHHLNEDTLAVYFPTDDLGNYVPMVEFGDNNGRGDHVSMTDHYHGDYIADSAVPAEIECHYIDDDGKRYDRVLIEWCCGPRNLLGEPSACSNGCKVIRLTVDDDLRTATGLNRALRIIGKWPKGVLCRVLVGVLGNRLTCVEVLGWGRLNNTGRTLDYRGAISS
jgi:hypothetical protein